MNKRKVIGAVIGIILFAITVVSITYAYYSWRSSNTDITFNIDDSYFYCETDIDSSVSSLAPTNDYRNGSVQSFHVNNIGRSDTTFSLSMNITSISDVLKDESFKYKLMLDPTNGSKNCASTSENGCTLVGEGNFSEAHSGMNTLVQSINLPNNSRYQYYFFMYLDGTMNNPTGIQNGSMVSSLGVCDIYAYLDPNGDGASVSPTFKKVTVDQAYGTLPTPTRSNAVVSFNTNGGSDVDSQTVEFKFGGWFKTSDAQANAQLTAVTADSSKATTQATIVQDVENHTLKARWQDSNGKYGETSNLCITLPVTPTKKGYTFNGWYLDSGANNKIGDPGAKYCPSKTTTIYAGWTAKTYTVKYDCNGGSKPSGKLGNATATFDQTFTVSSDLCTRTGYTQTTNSEWKDPTNVVWKKAWSGKWTYDNGQYGIANNELTLKAQWTANSYTIGYTLNGGNNPNPKPTSGAYDADVQIGNPTKTVTVTVDANGTGATISGTVSKAQTFAGWTSTTMGSNAKTGTDANPSTAWNGSSTKNTYFKNLRESGTVTMVANWTAVKIDKLPKVTKAGYTCTINTKADGTGTSYASEATNYTPSANSAASVTLYARCTANTYTIGYTLNGGSNPNPKPTSGTYDADVQIGNPTKTVTVTVDANGTGATISGTVSKAQTFSGWTSTTMGSNAKTGTAANPSTAWNGSSTKNTYFKNLRESGTVTMVANWTAVKLDKLPKVTKTGYTCTINTKADGTGTSYASEGTNYTPSANSNASVTLYARCTINSYTVKFESTTACPLNTTTYADVSATYDSVINKANPTCSGYTFDGWTASGDFSTAQAKYGTTNNPTTAWSNGNTKVKGTYFKNLSTTASGTVTLTANWTYSATPTVNRSDYNTFTYSATGGNAYYVSKTQTTAPAAGTGAAVTTATLDAWTTNTTSPDITAAGTYYVWVKDATTGGNVSANSKTIVAYSISRSQGAGTSLTTKYDTTTEGSGTAFTATTVMLAGTPVWAKAVLTTGYTGTVTLKHGSTSMTASGGTFNVSATEAITSAGASYLQYTVKFATGNNNCTLNTTTYADITATYNSNIKSSAIANPTCSGYTFDGWTASGDFSTAQAKYGTTNNPTTAWSNGNTKVKGTYFKNLSTTASGTVTLTANWTANTYKITLDNQSATSAGTTQVWYQYNTTKTINNATCYYYTDSTLTTCLTNYTITKPTKTGNTFGGYYTATNGGGTNYINTSGQFINNIYQKLPSQINSSYTDTITLYAKWTANTYTIGYTLNGGNNPSPKPTSGTYGADVQIGNPTKTFTVNIDANSQGATIKNSGGTAVTSASSTQTFSGWTSTTVGSNAKSGTSANPTAAWNGSSTKNTHFMNLRESGTVTMVANWTAVNVTLPLITKTGHTCGYATSASGAIAYASGAAYTPSTTTNSATLYARCTINSYTLTINPNGGSFNNTTNNTTVTQNYNTTYSVLNNPTRAGYVFNGWTLSGSGSFNIYDSSVTPTETKTFNYNASNSTLPNAYNNSGGGTVTNSMVADSTATGGYSLKVVTNGTASPGAGGIYIGSAYSTTAGRINVVEVKAKIPTGYTIQLAGISYPYTGVGSAYKCADCAGTGAWKTYYLVVYTGDTGSFSPTVYINLTGSNNTSVTWYVNSVVVKSFTKAQYKSIYTFGTGNGTLTANWAVGGSRVTFNNNGGTFDTTKVKNWTNGYSNVTTSSANRILEYNKSYATYPGDSNYNWIPDTRVISRTGHTFDGWQTANNGGTKVFNANGTLISSVSGYSDSSGKWIKYDANVTLYAKWNVNSYTLTYDCTTNGGSTANSTQSYNYGATVDLTKTCTKSGWTFVGWAESSTATTKLNSYTMPASNKTLYAIYRKEAITRKITFNLNGNTSFTYNGTKKTATTTYDACTIAAVYNTATQATSCSATITMPTIEAPTNTPTVKGWSTGATTYSGYLAVSSSQSITFDSDKTYYAQTEKAAVDGNVTFKLNGNTNFIGKSGFGLGTTTYTADKTVKICTIAATHNGTAQAATCTASGTMPKITAPTNTPTLIGWSNGQNTHTATYTSEQASVTLTSGTTWWAQTTKAAVNGNVTFKLNGNTNFIGKSGFGLGTTTYTADKTVKICTIAATYNGTAQAATCTASGTMPKITAPTNTPTLIGWSNGQNTHTATYTSEQASVTLTSGTTWWAQTTKAAVDGNVTFKLNGNTNFIGKSGFGLGTTTYTADKTVKICTIAATYNGVAQAATCTASGTMPKITAPANTPTVIGWSNAAATHTATYTSEQTSVTLTSGSTWYAQSSKAAVDGNVTFKLNGNTNFIGKSGFGLGTTTYTADKTVKICTIAATYNGTAQAATCTASGTMPKITAPTNTPTLIGWSNGQNTHTATYTSEQTSVTLTSGTTWYAQTKHSTNITITFYKNGASTQTNSSGTAVSDNTVTRACTKFNGASSCSVTSPTIVAASGFNVVGYNTSASSTTSGWTHNSAKTVSANANWYAVTKSTAQLTATPQKNISSATGTASAVSCYRYNGGSSCNVTAPAANSYTYTNWSIIGWKKTNDTTTTTSTATSGDANPGASLSLTANTNIVAIWRKTVAVTVTFDKNGGSANTTSAAVNTYMYNGATSLTGNLTFTAPAYTTRSGWTPIGYADSSSDTASEWNKGATKSISVAGLSVDATATTATKASGYYHIWKNDNAGTVYTATPQKNVSSATGSPSALSCTIATVYNNATRPTSCNITTPAANAYSLSSWTLFAWVNAGTSTTSSATSGTNVNTSMAISGNINLVALWKKTPTITVTFDKNGGNANTSTTFTSTIYNGATTVASASRSLTAPACTTRTGYTCLGYGDNAGDTASEWNVGASKSITVPAATVAIGATTGSVASGYYHVWKGNTYTSTFYYNSNTTSGSTTVASKQVSCTVSNTAGNCSVTIPTEVTGSGGTYNNAYAGLSSSTGNMTQAVAAGTTSLTLTSSPTYYSLYRTEIKIVYPTSTTAATSKSTYQNQWFSSTTAMATTVLSTTTTGTTTNATAATVSGYGTLVGFNTAASNNTANSGATIAALTQTNSGRNASRTVYQINKKTETVTATFYYYNGSAQATTTNSGTKTTFIRPTSATAAGTSVSHGALTSPSIPALVSSSTGPVSLGYIGVSTSASSTTTTTSITTASTKYYAVYGGSYTASFTKENNNVSGIGSTSLSCSGSYTTNGTTYSGTPCSVTLPAITAATGYVAKGWYNSTGTTFVGNAGSSVTLTANTTYMAKAVRLTASDFSYDNSETGVDCDDTQCMIDWLDGFYPGAYVSYTPTKTSYTTDMSKTGYTSTQTINPSELNLWRVLRKNNNGTVDIISEYVSSTDVYFKGQTGYQNLVGYLNVLASQYENSTYTSGSRYFGYNGQTQYITDTSKFISTAPWSCDTGGSCSPAPVESQGGGDTLYTTDYNLVNTALGTRVANKVGTTTATNYWMASRYYKYNSSTWYLWEARYINTNGFDSYLFLYENNDGFWGIERSFALRPIVTLKASTVCVSGDGTQGNPCIVG